MTRRADLKQEVVKDLIATVLLVLQQCTEQIRIPDPTPRQRKNSKATIEQPHAMEDNTSSPTNKTAAEQTQKTGKKRRTYAQALFQKRDTVTLADAPVPPALPQAQQQAPNQPSKFVRENKPPREPQAVTVASFWVVDTPDPKEISYKEWRSNLYQQGAPPRSIIELRHPLRNVLEIITTQQHVTAVMNAAAKLNSNIKNASPYQRVWEAPEPLTETQVARMALSYANSIKYSPSQIVRQYLRSVATIGAKILMQEQQVELSQKICSVLDAAS